jgi:hypothetical protein
MPHGLAERRAVALEATTALGLSIPAVIDGDDGTVGLMYSAWPARIVVVDADGKVALNAGVNGISSMDGDGLGGWLRAHFGEAAQSSSTKL